MNYWLIKWRNRTKDSVGSSVVYERLCESITFSGIDYGGDHYGSSHLNIPIGDIFWDSSLVYQVLPH